MLENLELTTLTDDELAALEGAIFAEKKDRAESRIKSARDEILSLAASVGRSVEEIMSLTAKPKRREAAQLVVKFRNTTNPDETWSGRGKRPRWLQQALLNGADLDSFAVSEAA